MFSIQCAHMSKFLKLGMYSWLYDISQKGLRLSTSSSPLVLYISSYIVTVILNVFPDKAVLRPTNYVSNSTSQEELGDHFDAK